MVSSFLAHLSWKLKSVSCLIRWHSAFVCSSVPSSVNFLHFRLFLQSHWVNYSQTWHRASLGEGDSSSFKWRATSFPKGRQLRNSKNVLTKFKNLPQNHLANFNQQTWHKTSFAKGKINFFIWRATPFSNWRLLRNSENTLTKFKNLLLQNQ